MDADGTDGDLLDQAIALGREDDRQEEERRKREEEEEEEGDRRRREEEEERRRREEEERRRREEEEERREREEEEMRRREEERRRRQEEWRRKEEEWRREEEEMRRREEEMRRREEESRRQEEEWGRRQEEQRKQEGKQLKQGRRREGNLETTRPPFPIKPYSENESRVERTLYVNTWLLIIILLLLALVLGKRVFKKVSSSWLKATHPKDVQGTRAEDQERTGGIEEDFTTDNTDIMHESALLLNYDDESPELNQQVCTAETKGACVHRGDLPFQVRQAKHFLSLSEDLRQLFIW